ncbi:cold-shock protein [Pseudoruegeria aquimaris]|nr:cold shock domain-containing protein [Pseudoruegeria aquimaris]
MTEQKNLGQLVQGHVKWFDPGKGFGFVVSDEGGADILLHANVLRNFGQSSVADHAKITVMVQETDRGAQAVEVLSIAAPEGDGEPVLEDLAGYDAATLEAAPLCPARVKWFDKAKGFGFANIFGSSDDVFVHVEVLRRSGLSDLQPGEAVGLRVVQGKRGRMATHAASWEAAARAATSS